MNPGRMVVTSGGPIQESVAEDAANLSDDPIFSVGGDLAFNWVYGDNGHRIVMTGGFLAPPTPVRDVSEDNTHGLGNHFGCRCNVNVENTAAWKHEISNIKTALGRHVRTKRCKALTMVQGAVLKVGRFTGITLSSYHRRRGLSLDQDLSCRPKSLKHVRNAAIPRSLEMCFMQRHPFVRYQFYFKIVFKSKTF